MTDELLFYDIEVFKQNSLVIFKNIDKKIVRSFHNNFAKLKDFVQGKTLVGYNNYYYDDKILTYMMEGKSQKQIKELNDRLISGENVRLKINFHSLDTFQQIDVSNPSLKKVEGNMGRMILESSVPFTQEEPLTNDQFLEVYNYCSYDIDTTIDIYKIRDKSYFQPKQSLIDMYGNEKAYRWNTTTISGNLLSEKPMPRWFKHNISDELISLVPDQVQDMWAAQDNYLKFIKQFVKNVKTVKIENFDCDIQFGFGGLHGAHKHIKKAKKVKLLDVVSMYPSIIILLKILGDATGKYKEILERRIAIKHKDPILSDALKLILNSVFGNLNNRFSVLYNPMGLLSVVMYGQIALYNLCQRIAPFATIVNINTDGVAFIPNEGDTGYIEAYKAWEQEFSLCLEEKEFSLLVQKDVNNYIAVKGDKIICKGGDVNRYEKDAFFKNNNSRILDIALVDYLIHGKKVDDTLYENLDKPHLFQYILRAGNTYKSTCSENGEVFNKVNRIFASKQEGFCLFKQKHDGNLVKFADAPNHMYLHNDDCSTLENFEKIIDLDHYAHIVNKRLERWI